MNKAEVKAFDLGFLAAATGRAEIAVFTGEVDHKSAGDVAEEMIQMAEQLRAANERIDQLEAGFQPYPDSLVRTTFRCGVLVGAGVVGLAFTIARAWGWL